MTISGSSSVKSSYTETENYHDKIQRMQRQIEQYQKQLVREQEQLQKYLADDNEEAARMSRGVITQYQQMINSLEEQIASMQRKIEREANTPDVESIDEAVLEQQMEEIMATVEELKEKFDTFAAGTEDPAKATPVIYQLLQEEDETKIAFGPASK